MSYPLIFETNLVSADPTVCAIAVFKSFTEISENLQQNLTILPVALDKTSIEETVGAWDSATSASDRGLSDKDR